MTYPAGVTTITVTASGFLDMFGTEATLTVRVRPLFGSGAKRLVWAATGETLNARPMSFIGRREPVEFEVPITDQAGWLDGMLTPYTGWAYEATSTVTAPDGTEKATWRQVFQPIAADGETFDLDQVPDAVFGEQAIAIPVAGPRGPVGPTGPQGIEGPVGPEGEPGPAIPEDQLATLGTQFARTEIGEAAAAATQRTLAKLRRGQQNVNIVCGPGDSTVGSSPATPSVRWPWRLGVGLAAQFPKFTFQIRHWDPNLLSGTGINDYAAATTLQVGTGTDNAGGPYVCTIWVAGVGNSSTDYVLGNMDKMVTAVQPDIMIPSHGHNEQHTMLPFITPTQYKGQYLAMTEALRAAAPSASILVMGQNPDPNSNDQAVKADEYQKVAELKGYGFIDIHQAFIDYHGGDGSWVTDLMQSPTDKHPNAAGQQLIADELLKAFTYRRNQPTTDPRPSSFLEPVEPLNYNPTFEDWADGAAAPVGYRLIGATASWDYDNVSDEALGRSLKLTATGAAPSAIEFRAPASRFRNEPVTMFVQMLLPAGAPDTAGSVQMGSQINSNGDPTSLVTWRNARSNSIARGKWVPVVLAHTVTATGAWVVGRVYADTANNAAAVINLQRILLVRGPLPRARSSRKDTALPVRTFDTLASLRDLKFAWKAQDLVTAGGVNGDVIAQLTDTSGAANHGIQATTAKRAVLDTVNTMGGKATAKFTAANNQWYKLGLTQPAKTTVFIAFRDYVSGSLLGNWGITTNAQSQEVDLAHLGRNPSDRKLTYPTGIRLDAAGAHLLEQRYNYTDGIYELWLDGLLIGARDPSNTISLPAAPYIVGAYRDTSTNQPLEGRIAGVYIIDKLYSDRERRGAQDRLATEFGVTLLDRV